MYLADFLFVFLTIIRYFFVFFFQAEDGIRDVAVTGVQTCALPIWNSTGGQLRMLAEWDAPSKVARVQIDRGNPAPRRFHAGKTFFVQQLIVAFEIEPEAGSGLGV